MIETHFDLDKFEFTSDMRVALLILRNNILSQVKIVNIQKDSYVKIEDNYFELLLKHSFDDYRIIHITVNHNFLKLSTCFMKDSLTYQLKGEKEINFNILIYKYFHAIFSGKFSKTFHYRKKKPIYVSLDFDDDFLRDRTYFIFKNFIKLKIFGYRPEYSKKYRYISFFETYTEKIKNS